MQTMTIKTISYALLLSLTALLSACDTIKLKQSVGYNIGAYIDDVDGKSYEQVANRWDYQHKALLYVYRPHSQWSADEIESPSFYVNEERVFNIIDNGYTWLELEPGTHEIVMRRPLFGFEGAFGIDIRRIADIALGVEAGKVYYMRYSEELPVPVIENDNENLGLAVQGDGPLQLVTTLVAKSELSQLYLMDEGQRTIYMARPEEDELEDIFDGTAKKEEKKWYWPF
jgi:hypothetical protein